MKVVLEKQECPACKEKIKSLVVSFVLPPPPSKLFQIGDNALEGEKKYRGYSKCPKCMTPLENKIVLVDGIVKGSTPLRGSSVRDLFVGKT